MGASGDGVVGVVVSGVEVIGGVLGVGLLTGGFVVDIGGAGAGVGLVVRFPPQATKYKQQNKIK